MLTSLSFSLVFTLPLTAPTYASHPALRQCVVDPLLSQTSAHSGSSSLDPASDGPTNRHLVGLLPTVITATILGGTINGFLRGLPPQISCISPIIERLVNVCLMTCLMTFSGGRHTILRSALTKSLFCGSIHILLNEANLIRVRLLASSAASQAFVSHPPLSEDPPRFWEHWIPLERIPDQVWRERLTSEIESIEARRQIVSEDITRLEAVIKTSTSSNSSPEASRNAP